MVTVREAIDRLLAVSDRMTDWEVQFVLGVGRHAVRFGGLSEKQLSVLDRLYTAYVGSVPLDAPLPSVSDELRQLADAREQLAGRTDKGGLH
jgi:hypothetical protein